MAKLIISNNFPFTHVESEALLNLAKLLNPAALNMMVMADSITDNVMKMYFKIRDEVKTCLADDSVSLNCTSDVWTTPNNEPILALTVHWSSGKDAELKVIKFNPLILSNIFSHTCF
jgi:hypothetical protein